MYKLHNWAIHHKFNIDQHEFETLLDLMRLQNLLVVDLLVSLSLKQTRFLVFFNFSEGVHVGLTYCILAHGRHPLPIHTCLIAKNNY